jgi:hypothetical protein
VDFIKVSAWIWPRMGRLGGSWLIVCLIDCIRFGVGELHPYESGAFAFGGG